MMKLSFVVICFTSFEVIVIHEENNNILFVLTVC